MSESKKESNENMSESNKKLICRERILVMFVIERDNCNENPKVNQDFRVHSIV